jgi:hypothetical protein
MQRDTMDRNATQRAPSDSAASDAAFRGVHEATPEGLSTRQSGEVNQYQDELMAAHSADGRSPTQWQRSVGWQMLAIGFGLVVGLIIIVAMIYGVAGATAIRYAVVLLALLSIGGMPIWVLVNWRGAEERDARRQAVQEQVVHQMPK